MGYWDMLKPWFKRVESSATTRNKLGTPFDLGPPAPEAPVPAHHQASAVAREYFERYPKDRYQTEVEIWRNLQSANIDHEAAAGA